MSFIYEILSERIINALGWTILHSLWQGLLIGLLLFLLLYLYRYHSSNLKYNISVFSLVLICGLFFLTFFINYKVERYTSLFSQNRSWFAGYNINEVNPIPISSGIQDTIPPGSIRSISETISATFPIIITLWLLGVFIITVCMTGGFFMTQRLRNSCFYALPENMQERFRKLADLMKIHKLVSFYESTLIHVPVLIGYFKPIILLPFSAVSHIPCDQIEAIIAHELAHIRRNDYLVNIFQAITEALFFYHPVVWIINRRIRKEREDCCDDLAVLYSSGKLTYARALTSIHEIPAKNGFPIMALATKKYHLLSRVLRILKHRKMKTNFRDKLIAGFILASAIIIILLNTGGAFISFNSSPGYADQTDFSSENVEKTTFKDLLEPVRKNLSNTDQLLQVSGRTVSTSRTEPLPVNKPISISVPEQLTETVSLSDGLHVIHPDTSLKVKDNIVHRTFVKDGREMNIKMKIEKGKVKELYVNGEKIPEENYDQYQAEIDKTLENLTRLQEELADARDDLENVNMEEIRKEIEESMKEVEESMRNIDIEAILEDIEQIEIPEIDEEKIRIEIENAITEIETIDMEKIHEEIEKAMQSASEAIKNVELPDIEQMEKAIQSACEAIKNVELPDIEKINIEIENAKKELEELDYEKVKAYIEKSLAEIKIDREEIMKKLEEINIDEIKIDLEKEKNKMDEMLKEIEKLEMK